MKSLLKSRSSRHSIHRSSQHPLRMLVLLTALLSLLGASIRTAAMEVSMNKGFVFFAPETDMSYTESLKTDPLIQGAEIFVSWAQVEPVEGQYDWSSIDRYADTFAAEGKKLSFRISTASFSPNDSPRWLFEDYHVRRVTNGYWLSVEKGLSGYELLDGGSVTEDPAKVIAGTRSVYGTGRLLSSGSNVLQSFDGFNAGFDFKAAGDATLQLAILGPDNSVNVLKEWPVKAGESGGRNFFVEPKSIVSSGKIAFLSIGGAVSIDNVNISVNKSGFHVGNLAFPYYLDPVFKEKWTNFVKAMAKKFADDDRIAGISVGGFGRWEEVTLSGEVGVDITTDMWQQLGFTQEKYIAHLKEMIDLFYDELTPAGIPVYMCAIGFPTMGLSDQTYVDWKVTNYLAKKGIALKYNGWQSMASEWGGETNAIFAQINRYKHQDIPVMFEQGGQINSGLGEVMGHPLSMYNRVIIDNVDYYWNYFKDMTTSFTSKYMQYANEAAGSSLITRLYNIPGKVQFTSPIDNRTYNLYDQWIGLFQTNKSAAAGSGGTYRVTPYGEHVSVDGRSAVTGNIRYSIDDRQKYNGMYGGVLNLEYLDDNKEEFTVYGILEGNKQTPLAVVTKTGTGVWKTLSLLDNGFMHSSKNSGREILTEINTKGDITLSLATLDYVPAREWKTAIASERAPADARGKDLSAKPVLSVPYDVDNGIAGVSVYITSGAEGYNTVKASVKAVTKAGETLLTVKEYHMPEELDEFYIPLADAPVGTESFAIELTTIRGKTFAATSSEGDIAYKAYSYRPMTTPTGGDDTDEDAVGAVDRLIGLAASSPFYGLTLYGDGLAEGTISKVLADGRIAKDVAVFSAELTDAGKRVFVEPQTAGRYLIRLTSGSVNASASPLYLDRLAAANPPMRFGLGTGVVEGSGDAWQGVAEITAQSKDADGSVRFRITGAEPILERTGTVRFDAQINQVLSLVLRNETASGYGRLYWKTAEEDSYAQARSTIIPILPNDTEFREYSWPVGEESTWKGTITGLRFVPATGLTDVGTLSIKRMEIQPDNVRTTGYREALDISTIVPSTFVYSTKLFVPYFPALDALESLPGPVGEEGYLVVDPLDTKPEPAVDPDAGKPVDASDRKGNGLPPIILYVVLAVVLGALAFGAVYLFAGRGKNGKSKK
jgi:hypothetical protein